MSRFLNPTLLKSIITGICVLIVLVDFTSWLLSFAVEAIFIGIVLWLLWGVGDKKEGAE